MKTPARMRLTMTTGALARTKLTTGVKLLDMPMASKIC
jgi:hypothetical protein